MSWCPSRHYHKGTSWVVLVTPLEGSSYVPLFPRGKKSLSGSLCGLTKVTREIEVN